MAEKENYRGFRITDLWVFVGIDADDDEGVMAFVSPHGMAMPMVAADASRRDTLIPIADDIIKIKGGRYEIRHFVRSEI